MAHLHHFRQATTGRRMRLAQQKRHIRRQRATRCGWATDDSHQRETFMDRVHCYQAHHTVLVNA